MSSNKKTIARQQNKTGYDLLRVAISQAHNFARLCSLECQPFCRLWLKTPRRVLMRDTPPPRLCTAQEFDDVRSDCESQRDQFSPKQRVDLLCKKIDDSDSSNGRATIEDAVRGWKSILIFFDCVSHHLETEHDAAAAARTAKRLLRRSLRMRLHEVCMSAQLVVSAREVRAAYAHVVGDFLSRVVFPLIGNFASNPHFFEAMASWWTKYVAFATITAVVLASWGNHMTSQPPPSKQLKVADYSLGAIALLQWARLIVVGADRNLLRHLLDWTFAHRLQVHSSSSPPSSMASKPSSAVAAVAVVLDMLRTLGLIAHGQLYRLRSPLTVGRLDTAELLPLLYEQRSAPTTRSHVDVAAFVEAPGSLFGDFAAALVAQSRESFLPTQRNRLLDKCSALMSSSTAPKASARGLNVAAGPKHPPLCVYLRHVAEFVQRDEWFLRHCLQIGEPTWMTLSRAASHIFVGDLQKQGHPMCRFNAKEADAGNGGDDEESPWDAVFLQDPEALRTVFEQLHLLQVALEMAVKDGGTSEKAGAEQPEKQPESSTHPTGVAPLVHAFGSFCVRQLRVATQQSDTRPWPSSRPRALSTESEYSADATDWAASEVVVRLLRQLEDLNTIIDTVLSERTLQFQHVLRAALDRVINTSHSDLVKGRLARADSGSNILLLYGDDGANTAGLSMSECIASFLNDAMVDPDATQRRVKRLLLPGSAAPSPSVRGSGAGRAYVGKLDSLRAICQEAARLSAVLGNADHFIAQMQRNLQLRTLRKHIIADGQEWMEHETHPKLTSKHQHLIESIEVDTVAQLSACLGMSQLC